VKIKDFKWYVVGVEPTSSALYLIRRIRTKKLVFLTLSI